MVFTSASGNGSAHATRLVTPGVPLKRVGESCAISASFAISAVSADPLSASATAFAGSCQISTPFSTSVAADLARGFQHARQRRHQLRQHIVGVGTACARAARTASPAARLRVASVIDSITRTSAMPSA